MRRSTRAPALVRVPSGCRVRPREPAEVDLRAGQYRRGEITRVCKNSEAMTHACLVPWEDLDALSARESEITGVRVDYKAMDRNNVLAVPDILRAAETAVS